MLSVLSSKLHSFQQRMSFEPILFFFVSFFGASVPQAIAPPGSGRVARLVTAQEEAQADGSPVFSLEYVLARADGRRIRNIAVVSFLFIRSLIWKPALVLRLFCVLTFLRAASMLTSFNPRPSHFVLACCT